jgi:hypothetical protein
VGKLRSSNPLEDRELKRRIDANKYPTIDGDLNAMSPTDEAGTYLVRGEVTFLGTPRTYEEPMRIVPDGDGTLELTGESTFDVREFGLEPPKLLMLRVEPEVRVKVSIVAQLEE